jgi:hypothetical protein
MYEAFDKFLAMDTWYSAHPLDGKRFFQALDHVVRDEAFDADAMGKYMFQKTGILRNTNDSRAGRIAELISAAWAVREYLDATGSQRKG